MPFDYAAIAAVTVDDHDLRARTDAVKRKRESVASRGPRSGTDAAEPRERARSLRRRRHRAQPLPARGADDIGGRRPFGDQAGLLITPMARSRFEAVAGEMSVSPVSITTAIRPLACADGAASVVPG